MNDKTEIGSVLMEYDHEGLVTLAAFIPKSQVNFNHDLLDQLNKLTQQDQESCLKDNADLVLGAWFNQIDSIELADRDHWHITSQFKECIRYDNGIIQRCIIEYFVEPVL